MPFRWQQLTVSTLVCVRLSPRPPCLISLIPARWLDTQVGELGDRLSEGERQRIGLARVFLRNADLVLFDEPTSRLDALNEAIILRSITLWPWVSSMQTRSARGCGAGLPPRIRHAHC